MTIRWELRFICLLLIASLLIGCTEKPHLVESKFLINANPTSYTFNKPLNALRDTVIKLFGTTAQMDDPILTPVFMDHILKESSFQVNFEVETSSNAVFGAEYFKKPETSNDVFLCPMGNYWNSLLYFHKGEPFLFSSSFALKFKSVSGHSTMVTVIDVDPEIINGTKCCGPHGNYSITQKVKPTTIEEYTLILYISKKLGISGQKPIILPE